MPTTAAAGLLRDVWGDRGYPVDPVWIANQLGIRVIEAQLKPDVSGALVKKQDADPVIVLNATDSRVRQRFTCAHELGHYVSRSGQVANEYEYVDLRGPTASAGYDQDEIFANRFAAALLMPEDEVRRLRNEGIHPLLIATRLGVSSDAIGYRLKNLGIR